jgi:hypothetical protein
VRRSPDRRVLGPSLRATGLTPPRFRKAEPSKKRLLARRPDVRCSAGVADHLTVCESLLWFTHGCPRIPLIPHSPARRDIGPNKPRDARGAHRCPEAKGACSQRDRARISARTIHCTSIWRSTRAFASAGAGRSAQCAQSLTGLPPRRRPPRTPRNTIGRTPQSSQTFWRRSCSKSSRWR